MLPMLAMLNCSVFNGFGKAVGPCIIDVGFLKLYAEIYFDWLYGAAFAMYIPVVIYIIAVIFFIKLIVKKVNKRQQNQ